MKKQTKKFGLTTSIAMIAGIVIGSGIFFKTDDILLATGGNVLHGVILLVVGAMGIIFGGLVVAQYAKETSEAGGLISYTEKAWGKTVGYLAGWFQTIFYFPALVAILAWICAIYIGLFFGITNPNDPFIWITSLILIFFFFILNIINTQKAGQFQTVTLFIKLFALASLSIIGIVFGNTSNLVSPNTITSINQTPNLFAGLIACAFAYDGWFVAPSIAHEIKDPKKNLSRALVIAPILILIVYLFYFIGINMMLGPQQIIELKDGSVGYFLSRFMGDFGVKLVYLMVSISVMGALNGLTLGFIRQPYALSIRDEFPMSHKLKKIHPKYDIPINSAFFAIGISLLWLLLHFFSIQGFKLGFIDFSGLQIDSLPIVLTYIFYALLYVRILIDQSKKRTLNKRNAYLYPILALFGASLILFGGLTQDGAGLYFMISILGILAGLWIRPKTLMD